MNCEYVYTKNINSHLIHVHIVDKNNRRRGVYGNNLMNITLYICMNLLINLGDFSHKFIVLCGTLYCLCFLVITSVRRLLWGEIIDLVSHLYPLKKGARAKGAMPFQYKDHTTWPPLPAKFQWVHVSQSNHSERECLVYYLELLCSTKHVTIYIKLKVFFISVLLSSLRCTHLCSKINKNSELEWPPLPNALAPFVQAIGQRGPL